MWRGVHWRRGRGLCLSHSSPLERSDLCNIEINLAGLGSDLATPEGSDFGSQREPSTGGRDSRGGCAPVGERGRGGRIPFCMWKSPGGLAMWPQIGDQSVPARHTANPEIASMRRPPLVPRSLLKPPIECFFIHVRH